MVERGAIIVGVGASLPALTLDNESVIETGRLNSSDAWIRVNTGIQKRHIISPNESAAQLGAEAALEALTMAGIDPKTLGQIFLASISQERTMPSIAMDVHQRLGAGNAAASDGLAACAGSIYELAHAYEAHASGRIDTSVVIGTETLSQLTNKKDRGTAILFGDGAGAVALRSVENPGVKEFILRAMPAPEKLHLAPEEGEDGRNVIYMNGNAVFRDAVVKMYEVAVDVLGKAGLTDAHGLIDQNKINKIILIPHQANIRIMRKLEDDLVRKLGFPKNSLYSNIHRYGNTSAASIFLALHDAYQEGKLHKDDLVLLVAIGGGYAYGAGVIQWHLDPPQKDQKPPRWDNLHRWIAHIKGDA